MMGAYSMKLQRSVLDGRARGSERLFLAGAIPHYILWHCNCVVHLG